MKIERRGFIAGALAFASSFFVDKLPKIFTAAPKQWTWEIDPSELGCSPCLSDVHCEDLGKKCDPTGVKFFVTGPTNENGRASGYFQFTEDVVAKLKLPRGVIVPLVRTSESAEIGPVPVEAVF